MTPFMREIIEASFLDVRQSITDKFIRAPGPEREEDCGTHRRYTPTV